MATKNGRWWLTQDSQQIVIDSTPERIYDMVVRHAAYGRVEPRVPAGGVGRRGSPVPPKGATFVGHNRGGPAGLMKWSRRGRVLVADRGREFAFVTEEGGRESTQWRYRFEPVEGGTVVTESYDVKWIPTWARIVDVPTNRHRELQEAMRHTLEQLKNAAEARRRTTTRHHKEPPHDHHLQGRTGHRRPHVELPGPRVRSDPDQRLRPARPRSRSSSTPVRSSRARTSWPRCGP